MYISRLLIRNFKSIAETDVKLEPLTLLVGANAAGKSNLIHVFQFISDILTDGVDNAIAIQGGTTYLGNINSKKSDPVEIGFSIDLSNDDFSYIYVRDDIKLKIKDMYYKFSIKPKKSGEGYSIIYDELSLLCRVIKLQYGFDNDDTEKDTGMQYNISACRKSAKSSIKMTQSFSYNGSFLNKELENSIEDEDYFSRAFLRICSYDKKELMLHRISYLMPSDFSEDSFIRVFDFDPRALKRACPVASKKTLEENGSNLASVLFGILRTKENREKLTLLLKEYLPFVNEIKTERNYDRSTSYKVYESYSKEAFYADFLSDGTVSLIAIIIAFYFENKSNILIMEEPERNIHPKLLNNLVSSAEDVSHDKQVIMTTHNPELLKCINIENVRLVKRDENGFTSVAVPKNSKTVNTFLENDLGLDDLFLQDMLGD